MGTRRRTGRWLQGLLLIAAALAGPVHGSIPEDPGPLWAARWNGPDNYLDGGLALAVSPNGSTVFVTGYSYYPGGFGEDYTTFAFSAAGAWLWTARYGGLGRDVARALAVSPDGSTVYVTGFSFLPENGFDYATVAYSAADGAELWAARYANSFTDVAYSLGVTPDGSKVFVTGRSGDDYATVAYSAADGAELWAARYDGPASVVDHARSLGVSPDGSTVFVTGDSVGSVDNADYATVAYSAADGAQLWAARYDGPANASDYAAALGVSPDGSTVFVTGDSYGLGSGEDYATIAYSAADGAELWAARYNGPANFRDHARSLAVSPDGSKIFVTGASGTRYVRSGIDQADLAILDDRGYATVAYSAADGAELWAARYESRDPFGGGTTLGVSPDGSKLFVSGASFGRFSSYDYTTLAYSATSGAQLWAAHYDGPAHGLDFAHSLAVSADGSKVYVTGESAGLRGSVPSGSDYATLAYRSNSCASGRDEGGPLSGPVHDVLEHSSMTLAPYLHGANCDLVAANGL